MTVRFRITASSVLESAVNSSKLIPSVYVSIDCAALRISCMRILQSLGDTDTFLQDGISHHWVQRIDSNKINLAAQNALQKVFQFQEVEKPYA